MVAYLVRDKTEYNRLSGVRTTLNSANMASAYVTLFSRPGSSAVWRNCRYKGRQKGKKKKKRLRYHTLYIKWMKPFSVNMNYYLADKTEVINTK